MDSDSAFAERIRERYPEGLTGILALGGTRTHFILEQNRQRENPGKIDYLAYIQNGLEPMIRFIESFVVLGGQNMVIALFSYQGFTERGPEYAAQAANLCMTVINETFLSFYHRHEIDPYFAGIDTLLHLPENSPEHKLGVEFVKFQQNWDYQSGRRKLIWEVAPIPLFSMWHAREVMGEAASTTLANAIEKTTDLASLQELLYKYYATAIFGTEIPTPHFYLGTNRNGDLKLRAVLPFTLLCGGPFRLFYTPYPSFYTTRETLQAILENLAFGKPIMRSFQIDYQEKYTSELAEAEYQRFMQLSADSNSVVGLTRSSYGTS